MIKIGFTGDVSFSGFFNKSLHKNNFISPDIITWLNNNDFNVFNIEGPITTIPSQKKIGISLSSNPAIVDVLKKLNCNIFALSNNHITDSGFSGLEETIRIAKINHIKYFGAGENLAAAARPAFIEHNNIKVAIFGLSMPEGLIASKKNPGVFCDSFNYFFKKKIDEIKKECNWVILVYHGGEEYMFYPMPKRRKKLLNYLSYGIDFIICHHSHTVQGFEILSNKGIFYSLGNFIFDLKTHYRRRGTCDSVLLRLNLDQKNFTWDSLSTHIDRKDEVVYQVNHNENFIQLDKNNYNKLWGMDAARFLFKEDLVDCKEPLPMVNQSNIKILNFTKKLISYVKNPNLRSILYHGLKYKLLKNLEA